MLWHAHVLWHAHALACKRALQCTCFCPRLTLCELSESSGSLLGRCNVQSAQQFRSLEDRSLARVPLWGSANTDSTRSQVVPIGSKTAISGSRTRCNSCRA